MSSVKQTRYLSQCRLCRVTDGKLTDIFRTDDLGGNLCNKINQCLPIQVKEEDRLPKVICSKCVSRVEQIHVFRSACMQSEMALEASLREEHEFPFEPECCLKEVQMQSQKELVEKLARGGVEAILAPQLQTTVLNDPDMVDNPQSTISGPNVNTKQLSCVHIGQPGPDDYVLMKEESFTVNTEDSYRMASNIKKNYVEFFKHPNCESDQDILQVQQKRRKILPQMWDVYEKCFEDKNVTAVKHRRYIISKSAFPCSLCGKCFDINQGICTEIPEHFKSDHITESGQESAEDATHTCQICGKLFSRHSPLQRHMRTHLDYKLFACKLCGKAFNRKEHLSRHIVSHTGGRPYHCDICNKPFTRKEHLSRHRLSHPTVICDNKARTSLEGVKTQNEPVRTVDPTRPFSCESCGQGFARKEHLTRHQKRMHWAVSGNGENTEELKPYACTMCNRNFTRKEHLVRHHKIHVREYIFGSGRRVPDADISLSVVVPN